MAFGHVLRTKGDDQQQMAAAIGMTPAPMPQELQSQLIRPLAIIQKNERRSVRRSQGVQESSQSLQAADLPKRFRAQSRGGRRTQNRSQFRQGGTSGFSVVSKPFANGLGDGIVGPAGGHDFRC